MAEPRRARPKRAERPRRPSAANERLDLARNLLSSLQSTTAGLEAMRRSLEASGFVDAVGPYRQLQLVLLQQRAWARAQGRSELDEAFARLAGIASQIRRPLAEMATIMGAIEHLDAPEETGDAKPRPTDAILRQVLVAGSVSERRLRQDQVNPDLLKGLVAEGLLVATGWGRSRAFHLSPGLQERLAAALAAVQGS